MNLSNYGIFISPEGMTERAAAIYVNKVTEHLRWIYLTTTGRILFNSIKYHGLPVEIRPYTVGDCNAGGGGEFPAGIPRGYVEYSPDTFSLHGACPANTSVQKYGLLWDEMLFHELVHVFRFVSKKWHKPPLYNGLFRYTDKEEFYAVLLTNIYISDPTNKIKSGLRAHHNGFAPMPADSDETYEFFGISRQVFPLIEQFCKDHPGLSTRVAEDVSTAQFNPIAGYYEDKEKAKKISEGALQKDFNGMIDQILGRI